MIQLSGCLGGVHSVPHLWLAAADGARPDGARLLVSAQDLGDAAVGNSKLAGDDTRPDAVVRHLHDLMSDMIGQRSAIDEDSAELVDPTLSERRGDWKDTGLG